MLSCDQQLSTALETAMDLVRTGHTGSISAIHCIALQHNVYCWNVLD